MRSSRKTSVRLNRFNYEFVRAIADTLFIKEGGSEGNFSQALNFLLILLRNNSNFSGSLKFMQYKARYDRGERSKEVLQGVKEFTKLFNIIKNIEETKN